MSSLHKLQLDQKTLTNEQLLLIQWVNSINIPSCLEVTNLSGLRDGIALNDISSLILNTQFPQGIYRDNPSSEYKLKHNMFTLLKALAQILPNHLSLLTPNDLLYSSEKLFMLLRWMIKILDLPFYQKIKSSFQKSPKKVELTESELENISLAKAKSLKKFLIKTEDRLKNPETCKFKSPWSVKGTDLYELMRKMHVFKGKSQEEFLSLCKTGEIFSDLINVIEGKQERLKGVIRKAVQQSVKSANISKVLSFLRDFPKMKSSYLWSEEKLIEGDIKTIKGLIYDILLLYKKVPQKTAKLSQNKKLSVYQITNEEPSRISKTLSSLNCKSKISTPREFTEIFDYNLAERDLDIEDDYNERISDWLTKLDLRHYVISSSNFVLKENLKNGLILCEIAELVSGKKGIAKHMTPKSIFEASENIENAFSVFRQNDKGIPLSLLKNPIKVAKGEESVYGILFHIMLGYPELVCRTPKHTFKELPYNAHEVQMLQESLLDFVLSQHVLARTRRPLTFREILPEIVTGVLLSDLVSKITEKPIFGITRSQVSETLALSNIKKSLKPLRSLRRMGQQYVYCEQDILKGNLGAILGLFEDLHRFVDKIPPRQRGENYHSDGPYFGRPLLKKTLPRRLSYSQSTEVLENTTQIPPYLKSANESQSIKKSKYRSQEVSPSLEFNEKLGEFVWLKFIELDVPSSLDMRLEEIPEFRSGVLLARAVEKLERRRISGVRDGCMNKAVCLHNLGKVLEILRSKPNFPSFLCFCEEEIYKGVGEVIREVLREMYKIYRLTIGSIKAFSMQKLIKS